MPDVGAAAARVADMVYQERREDLDVALPSTVLMPNGRLAVRHADGHSMLAMSEPGFKDYVRHVTGTGSAFLVSCRPDLRAEILGHDQWREACYRHDSRASAETGMPVRVPRQVTVRTRQRDDHREVWSVVGSRYVTHDVDQLAAQLAQTFEGDHEARMTATYDGYRARFEVIYHSDIEPERAVAGEIFKAGIVVHTADDGSGSIRVSAVVWRNLCLNLIIVDKATQVTANQRHVGDAVADGVRDGIQRARAKIDDFAGVWSSATAENVLDRYSDYVSDVDQVFEALVKSRAVHVAGVRPDDMVERLKRAWECEPGYSKAAVVNAITRTAHTETWRSMDAMEDLESQAGRLLYQRVWRMPEIRA
jgi:hypothetical protein